MKNILVIDDDLPLRENIQEILQLSGYNAITAENGKVGVTLAQDLKPDLIICDITMPLMDGFEVLYILSKSPATENIPFIFLSAKIDKTDIRKGMGMGADDYLFKPFDEMDLLNSIKLRLGKSDKFKHDFQRNFEGLMDFLNTAKGIEELKKLSLDKKLRRYGIKQMIYHEEDDANYVIFIANGTVKTFTLNKDGKELITGIFKEGDFVGTLDLIESNKYRESAMSIDESELVLIPKEEFLSLIYSNRDVAIRFIQMLSNNIREIKDRLLLTAYSTMRKRVADALLVLQQKNSGIEDNKTVKISRENLAGIVGITPESISRTLHEFLNEKLIDFKNKNIILLDIDKLNNING